MGRFIVIEGLDGAGKSTQIDLLTGYCRQKKLAFRYLHFPRMEAPVTGGMISRFLRGEFGDVNGVDPYLVAFLYAIDRDKAQDDIRQWLADGNLVIADRYIYSNVAFQCAKVDGAGEKERLEKWIYDFEYGLNKIPAPDISLFLHVPFPFVAARLACGRSGADRGYLRGAVDIHEMDLALQRGVEREYLRLVAERDDFHPVRCFDDAGEMLPKEAIGADIVSILKQAGVF
jgi:dTMP kinase